MGDGLPLFKTGDHVGLTFESRTVKAKVVLASPNGKSLMLSFDALLGGYVGQMPVIWVDGGFRDLITSQLVTIEAA
jgi:hypothetical protein